MRWAVLLALALALPSVASQPEGAGPPVRVQATPAADTTLYFHVLRGGDFPVTPQPPPSGFRLDESVGAATASLSCVPPGTPLDGVTQHEYTTYYGFAAVGAIAYDHGGGPGGLYRRGLASDLRLDPGAPLAVHWFLSTFAGAPTDESNAPVPLPGVVVHATVRLGEAISAFDTAYNEGALLAQGETPPTTLAGTATAPTPGLDASPATPGAQVAYAGTVDGVPVYAFTLPLKPLLGAIPADAGFNVRIDVFQRLPVCPSEGYVMANAVRVHTSPGLRPRMELRERDPLALTASLEQFVAATVLHVSAASPWGTADVDGANATLRSDPPTAFVPVPRPDPYDEGHAFRPLDQVWAWNGTLRPGAYTLTYNVTNRAHTASAQATVTFAVGAHASPAAGPALAAVLLVAAAAFRRRA